MGKETRTGISVNLSIGGGGGVGDEDFTVKKTVFLTCLNQWHW